MMDGMFMNALPNAVLGELEDGLLGASQHLFGFVGVLDGFGNRVLREVDQAAQQRLVANDADVVLDRRPVGHAVDQRRQIRNAANRFHLFAAVEFLDQRDHVDRTAALLQVAHARINAAVRVQRKVVRREVFGGLIVERIVQQDRAQDRALGFHADGQAAFQTVIGGCHLSDRREYRLELLLAYCGLFGNLGRIEEAESNPSPQQVAPCLTNPGHARGFGVEPRGRHR